MMTAACCAVLSSAQAELKVAGPVEVEDCSSFRKGSTIDWGSPPLAVIHSLVAMQACAYCSSVDCAGTLIRVVTPSGDIPMGCSPEAPFGCPAAGTGAVELTPDPPSDEQPVTALVATDTMRAALNWRRYRWLSMFVLLVLV